MKTPVLIAFCLSFLAACGPKPLLTPLETPTPSPTATPDVTPYITGKGTALSEEEVREKALVVPATKVISDSPTPRP